MSWIKDNKFIVALGGGTLAGAILLIFAGSQGSSRYAQAKEKFAAAARTFPLEITFVGPEKSAREFLSSITQPENQFVVIRSLRITNEKKDPPRTADAKFDKPAAPAKAGAAADAFAGGFVLPGDDAAAPAAVPAEEAPKAADTGRILAQVLGNEQVQVFLRLDVLQFLPAKKLP